MAIDTLTSAELEELVLPEGQFGYDQRANVLKVGDGVTPWPGLKGIEAIATCGCAGGGGSGDVNFPASDGRTYAARNGQWVPINATSYYTVGVLDPAVEEVNKQGEASVSFFIPFKYAMKATETTLKDVIHREWRFPFAEGRIKRVSVKAGFPETTTVDVLVNGVTALTQLKTVTDAWQDYDVNVYIKKDDPVEIRMGRVDLNASDLHVDLLIQVGNAALTFIGESDLEPNLYVAGSKAGVWGEQGQDAPDGAFRSVYIPKVTKLRQLRIDGFAAWGEDGKVYACYSGNLYLQTLDASFSGVLDTPTELPLSGVLDIHNNNHTGILQDTGDGARYINLYTHITQFVSNAANISAINEFPIQGLRLLYSASANRLYRQTEKGATATEITIPSGKTIKKMSGPFILTTDGTLYVVENSSATTLTEMAAPTTATAQPLEITDIWSTTYSADVSPTATYMTLFVQTEDGGLYLWGRERVSTSSGAIVNNSYKYLGNWPVKKICGNGDASWVLMNDGKLYYKGFHNVSSMPHYNVTVDNLTPVYENYRFHDIVYAASSLVAIAEYLGEIVNN